MSIYAPKFLDGSPVPQDYQDRVSKLVGAATDAELVHTADELEDFALQQRRKQMQANLETAKGHPIGTVLYFKDYHAIVSWDGLHYFQYGWYLRKLKCDPAWWGMGVAVKIYGSQIMKPVAAVDFIEEIALMYDPVYRDAKDLRQQLERLDTDYDRACR